MKVQDFGEADGRNNRVRGEKPFEGTAEVIPRLTFIHQGMKFRNCLTDRFYVPIAPTERQPDACGSEVRGGDPAGLYKICDIRKEGVERHTTFPTFEVVRFRQFL